MTSYAETERGREQGFAACRPLDAPPTPRLAFIDNLRWVMIVLVVSMHAAVTYSHLGSWYFMEGPKPEGLATIISFGYYQMGLQAFFMGLLFLIAGYFVPAAFDRKGTAKFLRDRFVRLVVPAFFYMLVVHPLTVYGLLRGYYHINDPIGEAYLNFLRSFRFVSGSGPMWFTLALFLFCVAYAVMPRRSDSTARAANALPSNAQVMGLMAVMAVCTFLVRIVQPMGTSVLNMQLCYFSQYILLFTVGVRARRLNWLERIPYSFGMRWLRLSLGFGSLVWFTAGAVFVTTHTENKLMGGLTWQSAVICAWESFFCVGVCLGLLVWFREHYNRQGGFERWMTDNCFSAYLFHTPLLVAITLWMQGWVAPLPAKFLAATALGTMAAFAASSLVFRRIPFLRRVL